MFERFGSKPKYLYRSYPSMISVFSDLEPGSTTALRAANAETRKPRSSKALDHNPRFWKRDQLHTKMSKIILAKPCFVLFPSKMNWDELLVAGREALVEVYSQVPSIRQASTSWKNQRLGASILVGFNLNLMDKTAIHVSETQARPNNWHFSHKGSDSTKSDQIRCNECNLSVVCRAGRSCSRWSTVCTCGLPVFFFYVVNVVIPTTCLFFCATIQKQLQLYVCNLQCDACNREFCLNLDPSAGWSSIS